MEGSDVEEGCIEEEFHSRETPDVPICTTGPSASSSLHYFNDAGSPQPSTSGTQKQLSNHKVELEDENEDENSGLEESKDEEVEDIEMGEEGGDSEDEGENGFDDDGDAADGNNTENEEGDMEMSGEKSKMITQVTQTDAVKQSSIENCPCNGTCPESPILPNLHRKGKGKKHSCPCGVGCCKKAMLDMYEQSVCRMMKCIKMRNVLGDLFKEFFKIFENMPIEAREYLTQYPVEDSNEIFTIHMLTQQIEVHYKSVTLVSLAAASGVEDAVEFFIKECNADVNFNGVFAKGPLTGTLLRPTEPPLFHAVLQGHMDVIKLLVQNGANVNYSSHDQSVLFIACCRSVKTEIVKFLLENGAKINCTPGGGVKCLQEMLTTVVINEENGEEIFTLIVKHMEDLDERDEDGKTSLHTAVQTQCLKAIKILIDNGADINNTMLTESEIAEREREENIQNLKNESNSDVEESMEAFSCKETIKGGCMNDLKGEQKSENTCKCNCHFARSERELSFIVCKNSVCKTCGQKVVIPPAASAAGSSCHTTVSSVLEKIEEEMKEEDPGGSSSCSSNDTEETKGEEIKEKIKKSISAFEAKPLHPLAFSAYKVNEDMMSYLATVDSVPQSQVANAFEVYGAERAIQENYETALEYWKMAADVRLAGDQAICKENLSEPYEILKFTAEKTTREDIDSMAGDSLQILTQAVLVLERVVDYKDQDTLRALARLAGEYLEQGYTSEYIKITLDIHQRYMLNNMDMKSASCKELMNHWVMLFSGIEHARITFEEMMAVCKSVQQHLDSYLKEFAHKNAFWFDIIDWGESTDLMLYLLLFMESICVHPYVTQENMEVLETFVRKLLKLNYRDSQRRTFLHVAVLNQVFKLEDEDYYLVNDDQMACLLVDLGADIEAYDKEGNRPLHLVYKQMAEMTEEEQLEHYNQVADALLCFGAHADVVNDKGQSCIDLSLATSFPLDHVAHTSLQCLAARTVLKHKIPFQGEVPVNVEDFIKFHMIPGSQ